MSPSSTALYVEEIEAAHKKMIEEAFEKENIVMPFPTQTIFLDKE